MKERAEKKEILKNQVVDALKAAGGYFGEGKRMFDDWRIKEESKIRPTAPSYASNALNIETACIQRDAGLVEEAIISFEAAAEQALNEELTLIKGAEQNDKKIDTVATFILRNRASECRSEADRLRDKIPTKEGVLEVVSGFAENFKITRELSDGLGLYLLEVTVGDVESGEYSEYQYMRRGRHVDGNASVVTVVHVIYYKGGIPKGGHNVAEYNYDTGEWREIIDKES